jgi:hypothetical protein
VSPVIAGGTWLGDDDPRQSLTHPAWLATCRRRIAEVTGPVPPGGAANSIVCGLAHVRALAEAGPPRNAGANV